MIDKLIEKMDNLKNPSLLGLDTIFEYLPEKMTKGINTLEDAAKVIKEFNFKLIDKLAPIVACVKIQAACYEMLGVAGMQVYKNTLDYARKNGMYSIADVKRNDIGSTAGFYSKAYLGKIKIGDKEYTPFEGDFATINGYLGEDGLIPFIDDCKKYDKGIFVLVKTSNPSSSQIQNLEVKGVEYKTVYENMAGLLNKLGESTRGKYGYSDVGAVVGATHPNEAEILRNTFKNIFFLVPGYGAQGGTAKDLKCFFDKDKHGAIINNSRGLICAYKMDKYKGMEFDKACYAAAVDMREELYKSIYQGV
ncbi:MAG: orotidine-5'-phosphate decarboxylase [Firmicutes bacterium]|nr:orotidine-5'-phosphate decarboxylase [Bacillota bacterium]